MVDWIVYVISCGAFLIYLVSVVWAFSNQLKSVSHFPDPLRMVLTTIGGILATHFGATIGIKMAAPGGFVEPSFETLRWIAVAVYALGLSLGFVAWVWVSAKKDSSNPPKPIPELVGHGRMGLGVSIGALTLVLGV